MEFVVFDSDDDDSFANVLMMDMQSPGKHTPMDTNANSNDTVPKAEKFSVVIPRKPRITFLDLPENVRLRIYHYAGLFRPHCVTNMHMECMRKINSNQLDTCALRETKRESRAFWNSPYHKSCDHPAFPMGIFLASHAIRRDAAPHFFGQNNFHVDIGAYTDFKQFCASARWGFEHLRYLHIELRAGDTRYLKIGYGPGVHRTTMNTWIKFCKLAPEKMPQLRFFSLRTRVKELDVASRLICAMEPFPVLFQCAFNFNYYSDEFINPVLKRAALRLTANLGGGPPFPFMRLPKEVQLMVLDQLLTNRGDPYIHHSNWSKGLVSFQDRKRHRHCADVFPLTCCGTCSPVRGVCFCHARQTAYSTTCSCFLSPLPYFLVSREFSEDARRIFFSKNNFVFLDEDPDVMMRIVYSIPTPSFMQIRHLSFRFPLACRGASRPAHKPEDHALVSWSVLRRFIREHFDLGRLSLTIVDLGTKQSFSNATAIRNKYLRKLLRTFSDLRGLRDFQVYLEDDRVFEKDAEKAVLGPEFIRSSRPSTMPFIGQKHLLPPP